MFCGNTMLHGCSLNAGYCNPMFECIQRIHTECVARGLNSAPNEGQAIMLKVVWGIMKVFIRGSHVPFVSVLVGVDSQHVR
eukprot:1265006-Amphidinium_carterae.2